MQRRKGESVEDFRARDAAWHRARRAETPGYDRATRAAYYMARRDTIAAARKQNREYENPERFRPYGITREMFDEYLDCQEGACAYCGWPLPTNIAKIAIDHDHATGQLRGLTHIGCNASIGIAENHFLGYLAASAS